MGGIKKNIYGLIWIITLPIVNQFTIKKKRLFIYLFLITTHHSRRHTLDSLHVIKVTDKPIRPEYGSNFVLTMVRGKNELDKSHTVYKLSHAPNKYCGNKT